MRCYICNAILSNIVFNKKLGQYEPCPNCLHKSNLSECSSEDDSYLSFYLTDKDMEEILEPFTQKRSP